MDYTHTENLVVLHLEQRQSRDTSISTEETCITCLAAMTSAMLSVNLPSITECTIVRPLPEGKGDLNMRKPSMNVVTSYPIELCVHCPV